MSTEPGQGHLFVPERSGFDEWKWIHRQRIEIGDEGGLDVTSPEGTVLQKLIWYRKWDEASDRQWRDALGVPKGQRGRRDLAMVREQAGLCAVSELLERSLAEAEAGKLPGEAERPRRLLSRRDHALEDLDHIIIDVAYVDSTMPLAS